MATPDITAPTLQFEDVRSPGNQDQLDAGGFSLNLKPGDLALFFFESKYRIPEIANLATGMTQASRGDIHFMGKSWSGRNPQEVLASRREIGRVFAPRGGAAWLQNLDVDENVMLPQFFQPGVTKKEVQAQTLEMVRRLGMDHLPSGRPSRTSTAELTRAQWVRALLPRPLRLLVLERPGYSVPPKQIEPFIEQVNLRRGEGTAVLWIDLPNEINHRSSLLPTCEFETLPEGLKGSF